MNNISILLWGLGIALGVFVVARFFYLRNVSAIRKAFEELKSKEATERQLLEKLNQEKNELRAIIASMAEGVIIVDTKQRIQFVSANLNEMLEMRSQQAVGRLFWEVIRNQEIKDSIEQALADKQIIRKEISILGMDERHFSVQISPIFSSQKEFVSIAAVFHDITKLAKFERMRSEFVANVSHELKTPLTSIKGFVETLQAGAIKEPENAERFIGIIARQTQHLEDLVQNLLTLSVLESQESTPERQTQDIGPILQSVVEMAQGQLEKRSQKLTLTMASGLPMVSVDRRMMEQVFINLLENAIKFTAPHGAIVIEAEREASFLRVDIKDSGIGIPAEHLSRIFERFYRVDKSRTTQAGGTGLGLSIVKHILQAHQGKIAVQSVVNQGTTFSVYLPAVLTF